MTCGPFVKPTPSTVPTMTMFDRPCLNRLRTIHNSIHQSHSNWVRWPLRVRAVHTSHAAAAATETLGRASFVVFPHDMLPTGSGPDSRTTQMFIAYGYDQTFQYTAVSSFLCSISSHDMLFSQRDPLPRDQSVGDTFWSGRRWY